MKQRRRIRTICERQHRSIRMWAVSIAALIMLITLNTCDAHADTISTVAAELTADSSLPLSMGVADALAANLLTAQADSSYAASEPDSLALSIDAVLRAISLDPTTLTLAYLQSGIAIDDRAGLTFSVDGVPLTPGELLNFGSVPVGDSSGSFVVTPEPDTFLLGVFGLVGIGFAMHLRRKL